MSEKRSRLPSKTMVLLLTIFAVCLMLCDAQKTNPKSDAIKHNKENFRQK